MTSTSTKETTTMRTTEPLDKIICYPGLSVRILGDRTHCLLTCPDHNGTRISRKTAAQLLVGVRKGIRAHYAKLNANAPEVR